MTNLPQGWEVKKLGEIFNIERGGSPRPIKEFLTDKEDGINWIKIGDIKNQKYLYATEEKIIQEGLKKSKLVIEGDLLVSNSMSFGKPVIVKLQKGAIHDGWLLLKEKINLNKEYFYYLFSSNFMYDFLSYQASGSTVKNLNIDKLKQIEIPLPPLKEQERIVGILDESFAKIDESIKILEQDLLNLDELMQSALQKAFNPLNDDTKENYQLPQGWEWKGLGEICFITDGTHKTPNYIETGIPFLSVKNISKGFFDLSDVKYISLEEHNKLIKRAKPEFGDILICRIGTLGKAIKISLEFEFSIFVSLGLLKPKVKIISDYLVYFLNSYFIEGWINNNKVGGGTHTAKLNLNILEKCPVALPTLKEQEQIAKHLDFVFEKTKALKELYTKELKDYEELKQSLLNKAFKGEL
ncbi:TPA: restriction endonuclease subunit S [Campylobacter jejuni]|uniref:restriction endonuclease subunit S n=1 Tax=Campylobacter jejuni TaxID=197 RepID=UPI00111E7CB3|nr:restriction endonuclease subunit S [Campylobacter jejuni]EAJ3930575.1 restriction endonuclease subunit S [Campylobacter jejuni]EAK7778606.1 restriction endonuclease subunit S [Campylobacter jejuni]ECP5172809.1 restriction endonuclease subunit S [Campylobacter jejuni]ECP9178656.1 restriction endonuclease subunit S [Campylobacter jejuni]HEC2335575.1 restriction endonuclease subunit S [Campylobacter jejuni]